jgi:integrase/recombinase XerD
MGYTKTDCNERLENFKTYDYVSDHNYELFEEFIRYLQADSDISNTRIYKYQTGFKTLFKKFLDVNLDEAEKEDIRDVVAKIESSDYSEWSKYDFKVCIKKYYRTIHEHEFDRPDRVRRILDADFLESNGEPQNQTKIEALSPSEVRDMMDEANLLRDKFLVLFFFETGARIGEVLGTEDNSVGPLQIKDLTIHDKYLEAEIPTLKNDKGIRELTLNKCIQLLQKWLERHPEGDNRQAPLFVNLNKGRGNVMSRRYVAKVFRRLADKAGIDKKVTPHVFRHSAATYYATEKGWGTYRLKHWFGWKEAEMADKYCKENEERIKRKKLEEEGIEVETNESTALDSKECGKCGETYSTTQRYCGECGWALDKDVAKEQKEIKKAGEQILKAKLQDLSEEKLQEKKEEVIGGEIEM